MPEPEPRPFRWWWSRTSSPWTIQAQRYASDGSPVGSEFQVNTYTFNEQTSPSVAMDADGDFVVAWQSFYQDGSLNGIYAQRFDAFGDRVGDEFLVNVSTPALDESAPSVSVDQAGNTELFFFSVDLELIDIASNKKVWLDNQKIKKIRQQGRYKG